ncbi:MAG TPA: S24 family peptidase [Caldisericia bacterium]|jgi:DNA polymerase V|nr:S24 family peptidase [Caldisericia bacterium]HXK51177.1 S24 family peptidase [Caldisericia bacterium]
MRPTGFPSPATDYTERTLDLNMRFIQNPTATFVMKVKNGSTPDGRISSGDILIIDRSLSPLEGNPIIAILDGELKIMYYHPKRWVHTHHTIAIWGVITFVVHPTVQK